MLATLWFDITNLDSKSSYFLPLSKVITRVAAGRSKGVLLPVSSVVQKSVILAGG